MTIDAVMDAKRTQLIAPLFSLSVDNLVHGERERGNPQEAAGGTRQTQLPIVLRHDAASSERMNASSAPFYADISAPSTAASVHQ